MEATPRGQTVKPDTTDSFVVRLPDRCFYGNVFMVGWEFLAVDPCSGTWVPFRISSEGELTASDRLCHLNPRIRSALKIYKSKMADRTWRLSALGCVIVSMRWVGIKVEVSVGCDMMYPYLKDLPASMFNAIVDAVAEVFGDQRFALDVLSFVPPVEVVE